MKSKTKIKIAVMVVGVVLTVATTMSLFGFAKCEVMTSGTSMTHTYDLMDGCLIEVRPDRWVPLQEWHLIKQEVNI